MSALLNEARRILEEIELEEELTFNNRWKTLVSQEADINQIPEDAEMDYCVVITIY